MTPLQQRRKSEGVLIAPTEATVLKPLFLPKPRLRIICGVGERVPGFATTRFPGSFTHATSDAHDDS